MTTNYVDGGEAVLEAFRSLGVDYVMASPGSEWGAVWEAFARQKVRNSPGPTYLSCAHETLAVDLAIGYTEASECLEHCLAATFLLVVPTADCSAPIVQRPIGPEEILETVFSVTE